MNEVALAERRYGMAETAILEQLADKLHWLKIAEDGFVELYLDNHTLQTFRACEANFMERMVKGYGHTQPIWFLHLGTALHKCIEYYYTMRKHPSFSITSWAITYGTKVWYALEMDRWFKETKEYQLLGGQLGFTNLLLQYATHFNTDNERFRIVGTELYFGKAKEVPLLTDPTLYSFAPFRLYLSGKIDLLIDDGEAICPMDHKSKKDFKGQNPLISYEIQDGMTGYVYASRHILAAYNKAHEQFENPENKHLAGYGIKRKPANKIWMNFLQVKSEKNIADRFKRYPLHKTDQQLEDYRLRQISTAARIFQLITNPDMTPVYNDMMCNNWMHGQCPFQRVHRLQSDNHSTILNVDFVKVPIWNPEEPSKEDKIIGEL